MGLRLCQAGLIYPGARGCRQWRLGPVALRLWCSAFRWAECQMALFLRCRQSSTKWRSGQSRRATELTVPARVTRLTPSLEPNLPGRRPRSAP